MQVSCSALLQHLFGICSSLLQAVLDRPHTHNQPHTSPPIFCLHSAGGVNHLRWFLLAGADAAASVQLLNATQLKHGQVR